ncbi:MAG: hypothetical protein H3C56_09360 [Chitinophagaceae bacterium]|nr:hypothetical protein [Chitinophagaceae bacterium]
MRKILFTITFLIITQNVFSQNIFSFLFKGEKEISISTPLLWSQYEVTNTFGIYGADKKSNGESWSMGLNATYSKPIYKNFYLTAGIGYFKQNFDFSKKRIPTDGGFRTSNARPFQYNSINALLFSTENYNYSNYHFIIGAGYNYRVNNQWRIKADITYNQMNTFRQKYYTDSKNYAPQVNKSNYLFLQSFIFSTGGTFYLSKKVSTGINFLIPVSTRYRKDYMFRENTNEYFTPKSILGIGMSASYHF